MIRVLGVRILMGFELYNGEKADRPNKWDG